MSKWIELEVYMESIADVQRNEQLGIKAEVSFMFDRSVINVDKIVSYGPFITDDGEAAELSEIVVDNNFCLVVKKSFEELDKLIRGS